MKTPIAIISWEKAAAFSFDRVPKLAHIYRPTDLSACNFFALKTADIIPLNFERLDDLRRACEELQRDSGAERITLHPLLTSK